ncbi:MAG: hypothetical protein AMJ93_03835 [Anaerolineae bacterium SM23_84]|nr:MAG: hypothetical protein AMJ93_03835 [Anaerolineae bacterium SM23_84]
MMRSKVKLEEGWTTFLLLLLMLLSVMWAVRAAEWTEGLGILPWTAIVAMAFGLGLAKWKRLPGIVAHPLSLSVGSVFVTIMLDSVFQSKVAPAALVSANQGLSARASIMYQQALRWLLDPGGVEAWLSNFMFVASLAAVTWLISHFSTWFVFRSHWAWGAIVPAGAACVLNIYYAPPRLIIYFFLYCLCALLLAVRMHVYTRQVAWREEVVNYNLDVDLTFLRDGMIVSLLALSLAWTVPVAARSPKLADFWAEFEQPWQEVQTLWTRLFTSLNYRGRSSLVRFGRTMTLGGGVNLSNVPVLKVQATEPHYWRAVTYDRYTGSGWVNTDQETVVVPANRATFSPTPYRMQQEFTHAVRMEESGETLLFFAGQPLRSSMAARASLSFVETPEGQQATDVSMLAALRTLGRDQSYTITSLVSRATASQLRAAGTEYPDWVSERYLQLPSTLPGRVRVLAGDIVEGVSTPYDQAEAIQNYLRRIPYDRAISAPPAGYDPVDWFLFENRRGYCDYYASALTVLVRSLGIPARIAQGYASGEYLPGSRSYQVRQLDAHAWPEVYFPGYGWVEFEPTASQPVILRPEQGSVPLLPGLDVPLSTEPTEEEDKYGPDEGIAEGGDITDISLAQTGPWYSRLVRPVLALLGVLLGAVMAVVGWWYASLRGLNVAESVYEQMRRLGGLLGVPHRSHQTPLEYGESLVQKLVQGQDDVRRLVALYVKQRFGWRGLSDAEERELQERWRELRPLMWRRVLTPRWRKRRPLSPAWVSSSSLRPSSSLD